MMALSNSTAPKRAKGVAIITVMMIVAISSYMAIEMSYRHKLDVMRTGILLAQDQSLEYILSGEALAKYVLREDLKNNADKDTLADAWNTHMAQPLGYGQIDGKLIDLQGKFNINSLLHTDASIRDAQRGRFIALLTSLGVPKHGEAAHIGVRVQDWLDANPDPINFDSKEDQDYLSADPPYRTGGRLLLELSELMLIAGLIPEDIDLLEPHVSVLPPKTPLNFNTATDKVLNSYSCLDASAILQGQAGDGFDSAEDVKTKHFKTSAQCVDAKTINGDVKSEYFQLETEAIVNERSIKMKSILFRPNTSTPSKVEVNVIYRKHLDPFSNV